MVKLYKLVLLRCVLVIEKIAKDGEVKSIRLRYFVVLNGSSSNFRLKTSVVLQFLSGSCLLSGSSNCSRKQLVNVKLDRLGADWTFFSYRFPLFCAAERFLTSTSCKDAVLT